MASQSVADHWNLKPITWPPSSPHYKRIITQNLNGPCSLIAICNILILQDAIHILPPDRSSVSYEYLSSLLADFLLASPSSPSPRDLSAALSRLPDTQRGLHVNPLFTGVSSFRASDSDSGELQLFSLCNLQLVHGWLPDPASPEHLALMRVQDYDTAINLIVAAQDIAARPDPRDPPSPINPSSDSHNNIIPSPQESLHNETPILISAPAQPHPGELNEPNPSADDSGSESLDPDTATLRDALLIQQFLETNSTQLTYHGLFTLSTTLDQGLYPFFRNSHLSVLYKHHSPDGTPSLWTLVTDGNFAKEPAIVWESLEDVDGGASRFVDGNFLPSSTAGGDFAGTSAEQALQDAERKKRPQSLHSDFALAQHLQAEEEALARSVERLNINTPRKPARAEPSSAAAESSRAKAASTSDLKEKKEHDLKKKPSCVVM
ncbi:hypothetical protein BOTBODRAFT_54434 [Botryobasidium botryosum FD-172 SS1]|uniref:MINDY deubiquitinase domain-containing protein n=1 Tax=Botryobasidium botryosum (strain FD-172 SS1) TaxID=930990 RepID=A0A067MKA0_BOTB1|nr:hypothetical protein BOTBODRAFT_54434 [Botryobasidium botryosum FD-172 SS1]